MGSQMLSVISLFAVLAFTVYGQLVIKARSLAHAPDPIAPSDRLHYLFAMFSDFWVVSGLAAAVLASACWMLAIERLDVGFAYPFMALSFVLVPIGSMLLFGESLPKLQWLALVLIIAGVTLSAFAR
jgi:multidrug transporter EmrE-like cation transporter